MATPTKLGAPPPRPDRPVIPDIERLKDHLALVLLDQAGGPMRLYVILHALRKRGVVASESAVINSLRRDPERFRKDKWGFYSLKLAAAGNGGKR